MTRHVQVFFHTESEAESFKAKLAKYQTQNVFIDEVSATEDQILVMPVAPTSSTATGAAPANVSESGTHHGFYYDVSKDERPRTTVITFDVAKQQYEDVLHEVINSEGLLDQVNIKK